MRELFTNRDAKPDLTNPWDGVPGQGPHFLKKILRHKYNAIFALLFAVLGIHGFAQSRRIPTIDDLLGVTNVGGAEISPNGKWVAYTVSEADFKQDAFVTQLWIADAASGRSFQLTRGDKSSGNPQWSPDGMWLAFTSPRSGDKNQIFVIRPDGGEAMQLTKSENSISNFAWSEDGKQIAYLAGDADPKVVKARRDHLGDFEVIHKEYTYTHLWTIDVGEALNSPAAGVQRTKGHDYSLGGFAWSPDGARIAFSANTTPDLIQGHTSDIYILQLGDNTVKKIVSQPGPDNNPRWSPDGRQIVFSSAMGNPKFYHANSRLAVVSADGGQPRSITDAFDESPNLVDWTPEGVYFSGLQKTAGHLFRADPASGRITRVSKPDNLMGGGWSMTKNRSHVAFSAASSTTLPEIYIADLPEFLPRPLTSMTEQVKNFKLGTREVISWASQDGTMIEGVLIKPADFDATRKYPLLCVIHGGPTGIDRPTRLDTRYYPTDIWVGRGALVLKVNYRGSAGYGEKFRQLNYRNLGVGDAWDVVSGVDHLIKMGWVDSKRVGCMGWSQGGYISAFLTTSTTKFAAISVGAGISNWATYYYNTDITPFTIQYLGDDPADDEEIYRKTSPMSYIKGAKTPTLIQHGEFDRRVPIPNAYELRQGLEDRGVPVELIVYKGFGHGITRPRSMRAVMEHNLQWFNHYLFDDPAPDFTQPKLPAKAVEEAKKETVK